jgi:hypothetical protein
MNAREPPEVWLPTVAQIVMAQERAILAALDTNLLLAARTLERSTTIAGAYLPPPDTRLVRMHADPRHLRALRRDPTAPRLQV